MKSDPIFVPVGDAHVATVVAVPEGETKGLVLALAGTGRHNLVGSTLGAHLSGRLAEDGYATVRFDYSGVGDSPGLVPSWTLADVSAARAQAEAVLRTTAEALGVDRFLTVGTCYGSRVALGLASRRDCAGAICLAPPVLDDASVVRAAARAGGQSGLASFVRSHERLLRPARRLRRALRSRKLAPDVASALGSLGHARIVFLYGPDPESDHDSAPARELVDQALARQPPAARERFERRTLPCGPLSTFELLAADDQAAVLDIVVEDVRACFAGAPQRSLA
jgi:pimeloyl-ACP methyl ester carboxylesterase